jgi:hypothetical protein
MIKGKKVGKTQAKQQDKPRPTIKNGTAFPVDKSYNPPKKLKGNHRSKGNILDWLERF